MANPLANQLLYEEYRALKSEMLLRIAIQNLTILCSVALFIPAALLIVIHSKHAGALALAYALANLALALQWCHQGVRQCAMKQAILTRDEDAGRRDSWEVWLPTQRPANLLGSRWFVSTKLVFMGLCAACLVLALNDFGLALVCAGAVFATTIAALLTNPKEGVPPGE
ncbi:hypothetical protein [Allohahella sp. A8]|uniref:hypothetical protein n=1 Tax=Allohahella sp. A8 TaxID=3141461 RepID=UPI000C08E78A|nr:hypothetical protein [Hahellaceae bacterium]|tara:strand:+ start:8119 stop:8625 length:507 start_codon:yes stop_codon:yes gene_type:complete